MVAVRFWLGDFGLGAAASACGGDSTLEVPCLSLQGEKSRFGLNWVCLSMALLKALFCERWLSHG
jgi:hypothetical protein